MPSEAKYGLVVGLALVILIAVVFFRREAAHGKTADAAAAAVKSATKDETPFRPGAGVMPHGEVLSRKRPAH